MHPLAEACIECFDRKSAVVKTTINSIAMIFITDWDTSCYESFSQAKIKNPIYTTRNCANKHQYLLTEAPILWGLVEWRILYGSFCFHYLRDLPPIELPVENVRFLVSPSLIGSYV